VHKWLPVSVIFSVIADGNSTGGIKATGDVAVLMTCYAAACRYIIYIVSILFEDFLSGFSASLHATSPHGIVHRGRRITD